MQTAAKRKASCSDPQQLAEVLIVAELSRMIGIELAPVGVPLGRTNVAVDGFARLENQNRVILAEAWAHTGKIKSAQRNKVHADILKLGVIRTGLLRKNPDLAIDSYLAFCDDQAASIIMSGRCWASVAAREFGIVAKVVKLPSEVIEAIREAQKRQDIREADDAEESGNG